MDYIGLACWCTGIACFQFVLDKGQESDWFASRLITTCSASAVPVLVAFFLWEWYHPNPIVDVRLLKNRNFGTAVCFSFVLGMVLFGSTVLIPEFLQSSLGYTAEQAGLALSPGGFALMFMMGVAGRLIATKIDPRLLICIGFLGTAFALRLMTNIYLQIDFTTIVLLRCFQVIFMPLIFIPISTLNYVGVPREKNNQVSGISSFMRNIGGSIGTSGLSVFLTRQNQTHQVAFASHTSMGDTEFHSISERSYFDVHLARLRRCHRRQEGAGHGLLHHAKSSRRSQLQKRLFRHVGDDRLPEPAAVHHAASQVRRAPALRLPLAPQHACVDDTLARYPTQARHSVRISEVTN